jgi:GNAT superfamily N-acetyltransferase
VSLQFRVERLGKHDCSRFDCGAAELNVYLQRQAGQDARRKVSVCHVLLESATNEVAGFYTLSAGSVLLADLPEGIVKKLPRYPTIPVVRIGRLAIDVRYQGQKLGGVLLYDAIQRAALTDIGVYAVVVDAKNETAVAFYERHGFQAFESQPRILFLPVASAAVASPTGKKPPQKS